jgi:predicted amidohydrolase
MKVAILQSRTGIDPAANAAVLTDAVARAKAGGADMLFTPEMSGLLDQNRARAAAHRRDEASDMVLAAVRAAAAEQGIWVDLGSLALTGGSEGRLVNRGFVIDDKGEIRARYDKIHLFDVDLPTGESWRESNAYAPGERSVIATTPWAKIGLSICYDMRFPDLYRALSNAGAEILSVPAAFTVPTGKAHWHVLLRARAIEAGAFVIAAGQWGEHEDGRATYGHSLVVDPWGEVLLDMGEGEGIGFAELDMDRLADVRTRVPALKNRRPIGAVEVSA